MKFATLDHVVILVPELAKAMDHYASLGFTVVPGGEHAAGYTHNALVCFQDGSYLELIAFIGRTPTPHRWESWRAFPGVIDACISLDGIEGARGACQAASIASDNVTEGGRLRPDGVRLHWRSLVPRASAGWLPFMIEDVTPRSLRVPGGAAHSHANGATGIASVQVRAKNAMNAATTFAALFGVKAVSTAACTTARVGAVAFDFYDSGYTFRQFDGRPVGPFGLSFCFGEPNG